MGKGKDHSGKGARDPAAFNEGFSLMKECDFVNKGEAEAVSLSAVFRTEGVKSLKGSFSGEVGNAFPLVGDREAQAVFQNLQGEGYAPALG